MSSNNDEQPALHKTPFQTASINDGAMSERTPEDVLTHKPSTVCVTFRVKASRKLVDTHADNVDAAMLHEDCDHHVFYGTFIPYR